MSTKSYGQFCALARALDHVGDRWTLLIVRELLPARRSFRELLRGLHGISPALLVARLGSLADDGLIERNDAPSRSKAVTYGLTAAGLALEPAVLELIRWGARWLATGPGEDHTDPAWSALALRALLDGTRTHAPAGHVHVDVEGTALTIRVRSHRRHVTPGHHGPADASVSASMPTLLGLASGLLDVADAQVTVTGDRRLAELTLTPNTPPRLATEA